MPSALELERDLDDVATLAQDDVDALWRAVDDAFTARDALLAVVPAVLTEYGAASATVAAEWYDDTRLEVGARGTFSAAPARVDSLGGVELVRWGVGPLFRDDLAFEVAVQLASTLIEGGMRRRLNNVARDTITGSAIEDPAARGWQRAGRGDCGFCTMLIARGAVYTRASVDFASHDHCNCYAVPAWGGRPNPVKPYTPTDRNITDADRARVRDYLEVNGY